MQKPPYPVTDKVCCLSASPAYLKVQRHRSDYGGPIYIRSGGRCLERLGVRRPGFQAVPRAWAPTGLRLPV